MPRYHPPYQKWFITSTVTNILNWRPLVYDPNAPFITIIVQHKNSLFAVLVVVVVVVWINMQLQAHKCRKSYNTAHLLFLSLIQLLLCIDMSVVEDACYWPPLLSAFCKDWSLHGEMAEFTPLESHVIDKWQLTNCVPFSPWWEAPRRRETTLRKPRDTKRNMIFYLSYKFGLSNAKLD